MNQKIVYEKLLTTRELEVLQMMVNGLSNPEIAAQLVIEIGTVRWYTKKIYSKLGVHSRSQAILHAQQLSLFEPAPSPVSFQAPSRKLPAYATSFVGRDGEMQAIVDVINNHNIRLITLAGAGGVGKTRLSIEVAHRVFDDFPNGVFFVPLASAQSDRDIISAIVNQLNVRLTNFEQLITYIQEQRILLVLDNFEHLIRSAGIVNDLIEQTGDVQIIVTSRSSLNLQKEWVRYLEIIDVPQTPNIDNPEDFAAVRLFVQRAHLVHGTFSLEENRACVIRLSQLLGGLPLAIELAAAWLKTLSCDEIMAEIEQDTDFLSTQHADVADRHSSLRTVFDHSWDLLSAREQRIVSKLSVFRGGSSRKVAQQVTGANVRELAILVDKSILHRSGDGLLFMHELMRQYTEEHLVSYFQQSAGTKTNLMGAWRSLLAGDFEQVAFAASKIINAEEAKKPEEEAVAFALLGVMAGIEEDYEQGFQLSQAALNLIKHQPDERNVVALYFSHIGLAIAWCGNGDYELATEAITTAFHLAAELRMPAFTVLCLPITSIIAAHHAEVERSIKLMALAQSHPASTPGWMQSWPLLTNLQNALRMEVGPRAFDANWEKGQSLNLKAVTNDFLSTFA
jgi:DNA-binding CsgD family transcriptional regulator